MPSADISSGRVGADERSDGIDKHHSFAAGSDSRRAMNSSSNPRSSPGSARNLGLMKTICASGQARRASSMVASSP